MDYQNQWWLQWWKTAYQPVICHHIFLDGLFDGFSDETISADDYIKNHDDVGELNNEIDRLVLIDTRTPVMIKLQNKTRARAVYRVISLR